MLKATVFAIALIHASTSFGQIFYNGDSPGGGLVAITGSTQYRAFDEVRVLGPTVSSIWANMWSANGSLSSVTSFEYQFRTGMSQGNSGSIVASGTTSNFGFIATGRNFGTPETQVMIPINIALTPGIYFMSIAAVSDQTNIIIASSTFGNDLGPGGDPNPAPTNTLLNNSHIAFKNSDSTSEALVGDVSYGVQSVPEPGIAAILGVGFLALGRRMKRSIERS